MKSLKKTSPADPSLFHYNELTIQLHPEVYDPAEDSFLLLESIPIDPKDSILELVLDAALLL